MWGGVRRVILARPTWVEVELDCIVHNIAQYRSLIGPAVEIMAVVKADAYGHGAIAVARAAVEAGASRLAVASFEEAVELRRAGLPVPVIILGYCAPGFASALVRYQLTPAIYDLETARILSGALAREGSFLPVHIKVDTGMNRLGFTAGAIAELLPVLAALPGLKLEGLFTHLATADEEDPAYTAKQLHLFAGVREACRERGIIIPCCHVANSAAVVCHPASAYNAIRLGIAMYGYYPGRRATAGPPGLQPALSFKSRIVQLKTVPPGTPVSYGCTYITPVTACIATVPVGYGDGFRRDLSNRGSALVRGCRVPVVGRVCMDYLMLDVTAVEGVSAGDEVVFYGCQGETKITVDTVAEELNTIPYELLCALSKRVPRFYRRREKK